MPSAGRDPAAGAAPPRDGPHASPRVVIAAPLHNGGPHVEAALRSLLAQTHADFRLVLVDDASTGRHGRDRRGDRRRGSARRAARECPSGSACSRTPAARGGFARERHPGAEFWALGSDHDVWEPRWLETLVALLDADPGRRPRLPAHPARRRRGPPDRDRPRPWRCDTAGLADPRARVRAAYSLHGGRRHDLRALPRERARPGRALPHRARARPAAAQRARAARDVRAGR